jgi:hypothetical protein
MSNINEIGTPNLQDVVILGTVSTDTMGAAGAGEAEGLDMGIGIAED